MNIPMGTFSELPCTFILKQEFWVMSELNLSNKKEFPLMLKMNKDQFVNNE